jgi:hypothetical protein
VVAAFDDAYFDFVYIDTDHSYATTRAELELCNRKVKPDGRIAGHDFSVGNVSRSIPYGVIKACLEHCIVNGWRFEYLTIEGSGNFSYCLRRLEATD